MCVCVLGVRVCVGARSEEKRRGSRIRGISSRYIYTSGEGATEMCRPASDIVCSLLSINRQGCVHAGLYLTARQCQHFVQLRVSSAHCSASVVKVVFMLSGLCLTARQCQHFSTVESGYGLSPLQALAHHMFMLPAGPITITGLA